MRGHRVLEQKEYFDEYIECGMKNWAARRSASSDCRGAVLNTAESAQDQLPAPDRQRAWMEKRRRLIARDDRPVTDPMESFGFSWVWALHLAISPLSSMR